MRKVSLTHRLADRRSIEVEAETRGNRLRLRARLVGADGFVLESLRRDYPASDPTAIGDFEAEFARITGIAVDRLFPADLFSLCCPAAAPSWPDAVVFAIAAGTPERPQVEYLTSPEPLTPELIAAAEPCTPREIFRIAARCVKADCRHWRDGTNGAEHDGVCSLVERVIAGYPSLLEDSLQPCGIRSVCRWFAQEGPASCRVCPGVVTDVGELPQDIESEAGVAFF